MFRNFSLPGRSAVYATRFAAATSHPIATTSALSVLNAGGNAVDAAIAASATLCVVEPQMTGIGGDCFVMVGEPDGTLHGLNGSGRAPAATDISQLLEAGHEKIPEHTAHAVTVPGAVKAWETLHQKFGRMDFTPLFSDAIKLAEEGFPVAPRVASDWQELASALGRNPGAAKHYLKDGRAPNVGETMSAQALAGSLREIANRGAAALYEGEIAEDIINTLTAAGGVMTMEDLANVSADWVDPISAHYADHELHEIPPNGQGLAALILAKLFAKLDVPDDPNSVERAHLDIECGRIAYAARDTYLSDPETMEYSVETLLSDAHIDQLASLYDPKRRNPEIALPEPLRSDTVYLSIVDEEGMAVSFINSLFGTFGSTIVTEKTGITLHNRGCGFNLKEGHPNVFGPGKRPFHTIIPAMITANGKITHSFGVMGGQYQAMGHGHVLSRMLNYGMDPQKALDQPRFFWNDDGQIALEDGTSSDIEAGLTEKGHPCIRGGRHGGGQIIQIDHTNGCLIAGSDPRKDGHAAGF